MFGKSGTPKAQNRIDSLIGAGTRIEGNIVFSGGLRVDGEVKGNISAASGEAATLVVSEQARVEGEIHVARVVVNGTVVGPVESTELVELHARSRVSGDVSYNVLEMHLGAVVEGKLVHLGSAASKTVELKVAKRN